jgi:predicted PurR-regulated permease PerM
MKSEGNNGTPGASATRVSPTQIVQLVLGGILVLVLLYTVRDLLHPFIVAALAAYLWYPFRANSSARRIITTIFFVAIGYGIYDVWSVLVPFVVAFVFAFLFDPVVTRFEHRVPRWVLSLSVLLLFAGVIGLLGAFIVPPLFSQLDLLLKNITTALGSATSWYQQGGVADLLRALNVPEEQVQWFLSTQLSPRLQSILGTSVQAALAFLSGTSVMLGQIVNMVLIPFLGYYLLNDFPAIRAGMKRWLLRLHVTAEELQLVIDVDEILSTYLRGQLLVASVIGGMAAMLFGVFGIPYAFVLGLLIGVLDVIPYIGLIASVVLSVLVVLFSATPTVANLMIVLAVTLGLHAIETYVIAPRIMGKRLGLHPVVLILSLFVFAHLVGFLGLLIAVPTSAVISHLLRIWYARGAATVGTE